MALKRVTDHVLDLLVGAVDDHAAAVFFDDDLAIVQLRLGLVVVGLIELIDGLLEGHMRRILAVVERHVDDVQPAACARGHLVLHATCRGPANWRGRPSGCTRRR